MQSSNGAQGNTQNNAQNANLNNSVNNVQTPSNIEEPIIQSNPQEADASQVIVEPVSGVDPERIAQRIIDSRNQMAELESRQPALASTGNPNATIADANQTQVQPRYKIVQNRSIFLLIVADLKSHPEDQGFMLEPGGVEVLTDFYSPQEINRSRGLVYSATKQMNGIDANAALVPLNSMEEAKNFVVPAKKKYEPGTTFEDTAPNDFDDRFDELEQKEAKRDDKLMKKSLGTRRSKKHGSSPSHV